MIHRFTLMSGKSHKNICPEKHAQLRADLVHIEVAHAIVCSHTL
jgi:hypothetical protein